MFSHRCDLFVKARTLVESEMGELWNCLYDDVSL